MYFSCSRFTPASGFLHLPNLDRIGQCRQQIIEDKTKVSAHGGQPACAQGLVIVLPLQNSQAQQWRG